MQEQVTVGSGFMTINEGSTFLVTAEDGEIRPEAELGFFARDTRLISRYEFRIGGKRWLKTGAAVLEHYASRLFFVSPDLDDASASIAKRQIALTLDRKISGVLEDEYRVQNYSQKPAELILEIAIESDFADLFEVKSEGVPRRVGIDAKWNAEAGELEIAYRNGDFRRGLLCRFQPSAGRPHFGDGKIRFAIALPPGGSWRAACQFCPAIEVTGTDKATASRSEEQPKAAVHLARWRRVALRIRVPDYHLQSTFERAVSDMGALRLYEQDAAEPCWLPSAGLPWFVTLFGRDSLIAALESFCVTNELAKGALERLAALQAHERDDWQDAEPGKIMHEIRSGELAHFREVPQIPYYGTADATILFPIVLSELWLWTGDEELLHRNIEAACRCIDWIDHYGDRDGDGFQEYRTRSSQGYRNLGWKDAEDAVLYTDGGMVDLPIATCELQGYVYAAKTRMAELFAHLGRKEESRRLESEAERLKRSFNERFWLEDMGFYAFALDAAKRPVRSVSSNPGHLLWSGIVDSCARAQRLVDRLLAADMYSGWGIRTLSREHVAYNPHDYQRGSVWPHDNAIIAAGAKRYGCWEAANQIARGIFDASAWFADHRLPELVAGLDRSETVFPVQYAGANAPQAWAAGSIFLLLQTILGLRPDAPAGTLNVDPALPGWLPEIILENLCIGGHRLSLRFSGDGPSSTFEILENPGNIRVVRTCQTIGVGRPVAR